MIKNRVMALDYGERKIGVALSDSLQMISYPYKTIDRKKTPNYIGEIKILSNIKRWGVLLLAIL